MDIIEKGLSSVGDFFFGSSSPGIGPPGSDVGGGGFFSTAANFAGTAFDWIGDHPEASNLLGGVAMGVGQAYTAGKDREQRARDNRLDRQMQRDLQAERLEAQKIVPGEGPSNYGSYGAAITRGLLSDGMLAADEE